MSDFYTRMKIYREKLNLSQKKLAEKVNVSRETVVRLEKGQYNPSLRLAADIAEELHVAIEDIFVFAESEEEAAEIFKRRDESVLEAGLINLYDHAYQEGFEIGMSKASLSMLTTMVGYAGILMSEEKWERFKKSQEDKYRKYKKEHPDSSDRYGRCYDDEGYLIKEKWIDEQKSIMSCMNFPEEGWEDLCAFVEKYPGLSPGVLARRILRESEYKYI